MDNSKFKQKFTSLLYLVSDAFDKNQITLKEKTLIKSRCYINLLI